MGFEYREGELHCDDVKVKTIADEVKTPFYLYSYETLISAYESYKEAFSKVDTLICYAAKANSNLAILNALAKKGSGIDVVSGGELFKALKAGFPPQKIVFNGNGKTRQELEYALENDLLMINVDSIGELSLLNQIAKEKGKKPRIAIRINPDVNPITHPYIATGLAKSKFGTSNHEIKEIYIQASKAEHLEVVGIHCHVGSQIIHANIFGEALNKVIKLAGELKEIGIIIEYINIGGGLGIRYRDEDVPTIQNLSEMILPYIINTNYKLILEPGRSIVGEAGILVTKINYIKKGFHKYFIVVDAAMNDLIRPAFYKSYHRILPVIERDMESEGLTADIVGPICEDGDFFAHERLLPKPEEGDLLAILETGAYGFAMSSNYNMRPRVAEVMVSNGKYYIVRKRESYEDLISKEIILEELSPSQ
ncbi:MAG: diaminopimelate decarboxylase [Nitrospirota bacterium]